MASPAKKNGAVAAAAAAAGGEVIAPAERVGRGHPPIAHRFKPGNPGRPKGSRNKLGEHFIAALCADFEAHGEGVIARVREEDPAVYLRVIAQIVPQSVLVHEAKLDELSDDELAAYLLAVREIVRAREGVVDGDGAAGGGEQPRALSPVPEAEGLS